MKRSLLLAGPAIALLGSLGLVCFASSIVGVFDILTFRIADPPEPLPASFAELPWAVLSFVTLVAGLVATCIGTTLQDERLSITALGRLTYAGAGVLLVVGAIPSVWSVLGVRASFYSLVTSPFALTIESVEETIRSSETTMLIGSGVMVASAILLLVARLIGVEKKQCQHGKAAIPGIIIGVTSVLVGTSIFIFLLFVWYNGNAVEMIITDSSATPNPADLARHLSGIINNWLLAFSGLTALGVLQIVAGVLSPGSQMESKIEHDAM